jgi:hypothetical protein
MVAVILLIHFFYTSEIYTQDYYPLSIGNRWDYKRSISNMEYIQGVDTISVEVIGDSLFSNGQTYYVLNHWDLTGGRYVRADSNFVYYYDKNYSEEDTVYRLNTQVGDEWFSQFGTIFTIRLDSITNTQIFTISTTLQYYKLDGLILGYLTLSDKFGPLNYYSPGEPPGTSTTFIDLLGCVIDSVEYGNPVSVEDKVNIQPLEFALSQNYPNPFNPTTKIKFTIPTPLSPPFAKGGKTGGVVTLKVYDILGNEIATLVNEEKPAGSYEVEFDARGLTSGIYFYQLRAGDYVETKKMVLLR